MTYFEVVIKQILNNVRHIRESKEMTQEIVAQKLLITQSQYARFERGAIKTDLELLIKFAELMEMDIVDVIKFPHKYVPFNIQEVQYETIVQIKITGDKKKEILKIAMDEKENLLLNP